MEQKRNHDALLVTLADKNFIDQAKQLFSSVYWNAGWKGDYMLLAHEIPEKDLKWFRDKGILVKKCKPLYHKNIGRYSPVLLDKFYLFTPEFKKWKNIVYLDADIIVRASLDRLAKVKGFWAVKDQEKPLLREQITREFKGEFSDSENKFNLDSESFNAGVMGFSADMIKKGSFNRLKDLFDRYIPISKYSEQLIWNLFFYDRWKKLPAEYNVFPMSYIIYQNRKAAEIDGSILHFVNVDAPNYRPWDKRNPFYDEWKKNLNKFALI